MKCALIKKAKKMIFAFLGYSFLPDSLLHLDLGDYGLCVFYDYRDLEFECEFFGEQNYLFAFSMGVCVANKVLSSMKFKKKVALNGTNAGIDEIYGISPSVFWQNLQNFDFENFKKLCFLTELKKVSFCFNPYAKDELKAIYENFNKQSFKNNIIWDKVIMSKKDYIFPNSALLASFGDNFNFLQINAPHFALFHFKSWEQIFEL